MEHIDVDARYFKKQYDEIGEPPKPGDNWWLDNNTGVATVAAVEPLRADIYNFSESSKITTVMKHIILSKYQAGF